MRKRKKQRATKTKMGRVFSSGHTAPGLCYAAKHGNSSSLSRTQLQRPAPSLLRHNQQQVPSQSVKVPNVNSSPLNDMLKIVATAFQQIMIQLKGAE
jgi:hypothetical protein